MAEVGFTLGVPGMTEGTAVPGVVVTDGLCPVAGLS
jgi:hypothetical protein